METKNLVVKVTVNANLNELQMKSLFAETQRDYPEHYAKVTEWTSRKTMITCEPRKDVLARLAALCNIEETSE